MTSGTSNARTGTNMTQMPRNVRTVPRRAQTQLGNYKTTGLVKMNNPSGENFDIDKNEVSMFNKNSSKNGILDRKKSFN